MALVATKLALLPGHRVYRSAPQRRTRAARLHAQPPFEYSPSVSLAESSSGAQLACTAAVEKGEVLVTVPEASCLDCSTVTASSIGPATAGAHLDRKFVTVAP